MFLTRLLAESRTVAVIVVFSAGASANVPGCTSIAAAVVGKEPSEGIFVVVACKVTVMVRYDG